MPYDPILSRSCPNDAFPHAVANAFRREANSVGQAVDISSSTYFPRHIASCQEIADFVATIDLRDPRILALWLIQTSRGDSDQFSPGPPARRTHQRGGDGTGYPAPCRRDPRARCGRR